MSNILSRYATSEPTGCAVCHRRAVGLGYAPRQGEKLIWLCDDKDCHAVSGKVYRMPQAQLDAYEIGATRAGLESGGAFLDEIGITDLAALDGDQFLEFGRRIITGFEATMRKRILDGSPPF